MCFVFTSLYTDNINIFESLFPITSTSVKIDVIKHGSAIQQQ